MPSLVKFFLLAYLISWIIWLPLYLPFFGITGIPVLPYNHGLGAWGPLLASHNKIEFLNTQQALYNLKMTQLLGTVIIYGLITSFILAAIILASLYYNPRIWLHDLPKELQVKIPPKTKKERLQTNFIGILFLLVFLLAPVLTIKTSWNSHAGQLTLWQAMVIAYGIFFIFNLIDLLILDWLIICTITPSFIQISGIESLDLKNYTKHLKDFLKGIFIIAIPAAITGTIGYFLMKNGLL